MGMRIATAEPGNVPAMRKVTASGWSETDEGRALLVLMAKCSREFVVLMEGQRRLMRAMLLVILSVALTTAFTFGLVIWTDVRQSEILSAQSELSVEMGKALVKLRER